MYLLDANACIHLINGSSPTLSARFKRHAPDEVTVSSVVTAELLFGAHLSSRTAENLRLVNRFVEPLRSFYFDDACAEHYARIRVELRRRGSTFGANDLFIAATALANGLTLVTHNTREFERVPGLMLTDWETSV